MRVSNELRKQGIFILPSGVRCVWMHNGLGNFKQRLQRLEEKVQKEGIILTESQVVALERKKHDDEVSKEIETNHPGYLGSQDTFYVGTFKGVGRVYQQTYVDTYSKYAFAKLYTTKTQSPQTNGICERFHKTILQEFYQVTLRKTVYSSIEELQKDLDLWLTYYNNQRTHQGKMCLGRTPFDTLIDGKQIWKEKFIS